MQKEGILDQNEKNQKKFKKSVDNVEVMWYNSQAVAEKSVCSERSLKIEQQEISTKLKI